MFFDANPEEVPLRRKVLRSVLFAGMKAGTFAILAPVFQGKTCSALPSARAYLIVFAVIQLATVPLLLYTNAMRINKGFNPHINCDVRADEGGEVYTGHKLCHKTVSNIDKLLGLATLLVGVVWGLTIWSIQTSRGGADSKCDKGIYSAIGVSAWICVAIFVAILVYIMLIVAGVVPNPKKEKAPLEAPLDAEASAE